MSIIHRAARRAQGRGLFPALLAAATLSGAVPAHATSTPDSLAGRAGPASTARLALGDPASAGPETLTPAQAREVADSAAAQMERHYVSPDTGRLIANHVRARAAAGAYDTLATPAALAAALRTDLRAVNGDRHLYMHVHRPGEDDAGQPDPDEARRANYGFARVERLEGNVGYIRLTGFSGDPGAREVAVNALRFIQHTDAVILDVRGVPGGSGELSNFILSHFTEPGVPALRVYWREDGRTEVISTLADVPGPRRTDVPVYVLIDRRAASAAEDLPFILRNLGRATLVGERTMGAGRNNELYPAAHGMSVSVSVSRVMDFASGREWETVGVQPDIAVAPEQALEAARQDALRRIAAARAQ